MAASERLRKGVLEAKEHGILKEPYQSMTDEELIIELNKVLESRKSEKDNEELSLREEKTK